MFCDAMNDDEDRYIEACANFRVYPLLNVAVIVAKHAANDVCRMQVFRTLREALRGLHKAPYRAHNVVKVVDELVGDVNGMFDLKLEYPGFESNEFDYEEFSYEIIEEEC